MFCSEFDAGSPYAPATQTATLLRPGVQCCCDLKDVADMIATEKAVELASTNCVTINACIKSERCLDCPTCVVASSCRAGSLSPPSRPRCSPC